MKTESKKTLGITLEVLQWVIIIVCYLYFSSQANAQSIGVETYLQHNVIGLQNGHAVKFVGPKGFGYGVFHQSSEYLSIEAEGNNYPFTGVELEIPLMTCERLHVTGSLKGGFVNENFLVLVPEITTKMNIGRFIAVGLGAGYRAGQTSLALKLFIKTK